jgi:predicted aspartyl protease
MSLAVDVEIESTDTAVKRRTQALIDCGATGCFINIEWAKLNNIPTCPLTNPIPVYNVDGTGNDAGAITNIADVILHYETHSECTQLVVTHLGKQSLILGYNWLQNHNPEINWQTKDVKMSRCPLQCSTCRVEDKRNAKRRKSTTSQINACRSGAFPMLAEENEDESPHMDTDETDEEAQDTGLAFGDDLDSKVDDFTIEEDDCIFMAMVHLVDPHHFVRASSMVSRRLAEALAKNSKPFSFEDIVLTSLHSYADVFSETAFDSLPERRKWDHAIELEREPSPGFCKVYPMTLTEQTEMDAFLEEVLATRHIRQSKLPLRAPVFLIKKKDRKLRFVQDYQALNVITRKNLYPLPLIDDLIHRLKDAQYFTKLDVRWGYNNVRIHEGDEWKAAFRTNRGLFDPLVMYFGLTNSPATFQMIMNEIF